MAALSTLDLVGYMARLRAFLVDADSYSFADAVLEEGLRQAASDLGRAYGTLVVISGLDGGAATSVEKIDEDLVTRGAAGYCVRMRAVERADSANLGQNMPTSLLEWSKNTLYWFEDKLRLVRLRGLQGTSCSPMSGWEWEE